MNRKQGNNKEESKIGNVTRLVLTRQSNEEKQEISFEHSHLPLFSFLHARSYQNRGITGGISTPLSFFSPTLVWLKWVQSFPYVRGYRRLHELELYTSGFTDLSRCHEVTRIPPSRFLLLLAHGLLHPLFLGLATMVGFSLDVPTIGMGQALLSSQFSRADTIVISPPIFSRFPLLFEQLYPCSLLFSRFSEEEIKEIVSTFQTPLSLSNQKFSSPRLDSSTRQELSIRFILSSENASRDEGGEKKGERWRKRNENEEQNEWSQKAKARGTPFSFKKLAERFQFRNSQCIGIEVVPRGRSRPWYYSIGWKVNCTDLFLVALLLHAWHPTPAVVSFLRSIFSSIQEQMNRQGKRRAESSSTGETSGSSSRRNE